MAHIVTMTNNGTEYRNVVMMETMVKDVKYKPNSSAYISATKTIKSSVVGTYLAAMTQYVHIEANAVNDFSTGQVDACTYPFPLGSFPDTPGGPNIPGNIYPSLVTRVKEVKRIPGGPGPFFPPLVTVVMEAIKDPDMDKHNPKRRKSHSKHSLECPTFL